MSYLNKQSLAREEYSLLVDEFNQQDNDLAEIYPQSYGQHAIWLQYQLAPESWTYNIHIALRIRSEVDSGALRKALQGLLQRHPILRTTFVTHDGYPIQ